jgi:hypothetical protein
VPVWTLLSRLASRLFVPYTTPARELAASITGGDPPSPVAEVSAAVESTGPAAPESTGAGVAAVPAGATVVSVVGWVVVSPAARVESAAGVESLATPTASPSHAATSASSVPAVKKTRLRRACRNVEKADMRKRPLD